MARSFCHVLLLMLTCSTLTDAGNQIEGIFSEKLTSPGYYLVKTIPEGAKSINVTDLAYTKNFLSVRLQDDTYLFNENYNISSSNRYRGAGTIFTYIRRNEYTPETFYAPGPLNSSIDVMLLYHHQEAKIFYQYELPEDKTTVSTVLDLDAESSLTTQSMSTISANIMMGDETKLSTVMPKRRKRKRFVWKHVGYSKCSKPCAGGVKSKRYICYRPRIQEQVKDTKCNSLPKPKNLIIPCNTEPCKPQWEASPWSRCSVTCGNGIRTRELKCIQEISDTLRLPAEDHRCPKELPTTIPLKEPCFMPDCNIYTTPKTSITTKQYSSSHRWKVEKWSPCSVSCGIGKRKRIVTCISYRKDCNLRERPATEELCNMGECKEKSIVENEIPEALSDTPWLYSAWPDKCSSECGVGIISRRLYCETYDKCDEKNMPTMNRTCFSSQTCGQWFIGPWTECSSSCEMGIMTREVVCVSRFLGSLKVVKPINCPAEKPENTSVCIGPPCNATWFMSDWSQCSRSCGRGTQKRDVRCIGPDGMPINAGELECDEEKRPVSKRNCNETPCDRSNVEERNFRITKNENDIELECRDVLPDCWKIRNRDEESERRCQVEIYKKGCCKACRYYSFLSSQRVRK